MVVLAVPKVLRERLTDQGVDEFITIINKVEANVKKDSIVLAEEKFERRLAEETSRLDKRITEEISKLRSEMVERFAQIETKIAQLEARIETKIAQFKTEIIKWMFLFWIGQLVTVAGLIKWLR